MLNRFTATTLVMSLWLTGAAHAQQEPVLEAEQTPDTLAASNSEDPKNLFEYVFVEGGPTEKDVAAFRYFLQQEDAAAITAEQERLSARYPDADIDALTTFLRYQSLIDTTYLWQLVDENRFDEARVEIARIKTIAPGWHPSKELQQVMADKEGSQIVEDAFTRRELDAAIVAARSYPELFTCDRVNSPWRLAKIMGEQDMVQPALDIYFTAAMNCTDVEIIVASLQKGHGLARSDAWTRTAFERAKQQHRIHEARLDDEMWNLIGRPVDPTPAPRVITAETRRRCRAQEKLCPMYRNPERPDQHRG